jgi:hypothetical protein
MVAKHYSGHYLMISQNLVVFGFMVVLSAFTEHIHYGIAMFNASFGRIALIILAGILLLFSLVHKIHFSSALVDPHIRTLEFVQKTVKNTQRIIVLETSGAFIETALFHGYAFSGDMKLSYGKILKRNYPDSYFYNTNQDLLFDWKNEINLAELLSKSNRTYLYYSSNRDTFPELFAARLNKLIHMDYGITLKTAFKNTESHEYIYEIDDPAAKIAGRIKEHEVAFCRFEKTTQDHLYFLSEDSQYRFQSASLRSTEASFSENGSIRLNRENPFGSDTRIVLKRGFYKINACRQSRDGNGFIVAADKKKNELYKANAIGDHAADGWESLDLIIDVPESMAGKEISIYVWYPGKGTCFFDDLKITWFEVK